MKRWILPWFLALAALVAVGLPLKVRLDTPRLGQPVVIAEGHPAWVECRASLPWVPARWVKQALKTQWGLDVEGQGLRLLRTERHGNRYRFQITAQAPGPGVHRTAFDGIWVQGPWPSHFHVVQAGDFHWPGQEDTLAPFIDEMLVLRPAAVLFSGDMAYDPDPRWFDMLFRQFHRLEAAGIPVISCPGNHERKGWSQYLRTFGPHTFHRVDLGPLAILSLDSAHGRDQFTPSQFQWLKAQLDDLQGRTPILQMHHPTFDPGAYKQGNGDGSGGSLETYRAAFVKLCETRHVPIILSGHWHQDVVFDSQGRLRDDTPDFPGPKFVTTTALGDPDLRQVVRWERGAFGYRILEFEGGRLVRYTHDRAGLPKPAPIASTPLGTYAPGKASVKAKEVAP